ncbi:exodeoxyribonuclease VII large subunit [bacterium]|nr:exodeoxyribonuclease VII large subunit [bacterium]
MMNLDSKMKIYTVSELTELIKENLESNFSSIRVEGEISNFASPKSGHLYFNLKDNNSQIRCVMFRSRAALMKSKIENGLKVNLWGGVTVYSPRGEYQVIAEYMEPKGIGDLQLAFEQLKKKLESEGLFDEKYKKPIPLLPLRIGVITSPTGAAIRDIINVITRRFANIGIFIYPTSVQGDEAPLEIVEAIELANKMDFVNVLIVGRGGGSIEDLWAFNDERVARAIFNSNIPIISAVGHETDFTIADFIADLRAATPSAAAELVIGKYDEFVKKIQSYHSIMTRILETKLNYARVQLDGYIMSSGFAKPVYMINDNLDKVNQMKLKMKTSIKNLLILKSRSLDFTCKLLDTNNPANWIPDERFKISVLKNKIKDLVFFGIKTLFMEHDKLDKRLINANPDRILKRGYAIPTRISDGILVKSIDQVEINDRLNLKFHDGEIISTVEEIKNE